jgi:hypothetical protein
MGRPLTKLLLSPPGGLGASRAGPAFACLLALLAEVWQ